MSAIRDKISKIEKEINALFVERNDVTRGILLAILSGKHALLLGPPGTGKSLLVRSVCGAIVNLRYYEILMNRFTGQEEILGPISIAELKSDKYIRKVRGFLADAHLGFLDEIFKANSAILNSLLGLMNEAIYYNDGVPVKSPLMTIIGASNEIPESEDGLDAFDDRLQLRFVVEKIRHHDNMKKMLTTDYTMRERTTITLEEIVQAKDEVKQVTMSQDIMDVYIKLWDTLTQSGHIITDRVYKQGLDIVRAEAWINGRNTVREEDLEILKIVFWKDPSKRKQLHLDILNATHPEKHRLTEIYQEMMDQVDELFAKTKDKEKNQSQRGVELIHKMKEKRQEVIDLLETMKKNNKDMTEARAMVHRISKEIQRVAKDLVGITVEEWI